MSSQNDTPTDQSPKIPSSNRTVNLRRGLIPPTKARKLPRLLSPYRAADLNVCMAAIAAAAVGIVTAYNDAGVSKFITTRFDTDIPMLPLWMVVLCQFCSTLTFGLLTAGFVWENSSDFGFKTSLGNLLLEGLIAIAVLVCVYAAVGDVFLFRITSILFLVLWTVRCRTQPLMSKNGQRFRSAPWRYVGPVLWGYGGVAAIVLILASGALDSLPFGVADWDTPDFASFTSDLVFAVVPAGYGILQLYFSATGREPQGWSPFKR